jgi:hypothetical protein
MVDGPASAGPIDPHRLAMNLWVSYGASHFFVIQSTVGLEGRILVSYQLDAQILHF